MFLVVDDHELARALLVEQLSELGYESDMVSSGEDALAAFRRAHYDVIFMDVLMPGMDGLDTTKHIRSLEASVAAPRTFIIGVSAVGDEFTCKQAGMDAYVQKPAMLDTLDEAIGMWKSLGPPAAFEPVTQD